MDDLKNQTDAPDPEDAVVSKTTTITSVPGMAVGPNGWVVTNRPSDVTLRNCVIDYVPLQQWHNHPSPLAGTFTWPAVAPPPAEFFRASNGYIRLDQIGMVTVSPKGVVTVFSTVPGAVVTLEPADAERFIALMDARSSK